MKRIALVLMLALAACGGGSAKTAATGTTASTVVSTTTASEDIPAAGQRYLDIVKPANDGFDVVVKAWRAIGDSGFVSEYAKAAAPLFPLLQAQQQALLRTAWPAVAQADVRALVTTTAAEIGDLSSLGAQTTDSFATWSTQWLSDVSRSSAAASAVRADLGLPPPKS